MLNAITPPISSLASPAASPAAGLSNAGDDRELRGAFDAFVGETFYAQMLSAMRKTVGKPAYFDGGRAEEVFRGQLDQVLSEKMAQSNPQGFTRSMFELFSLQRG